MSSDKKFSLNENFSRRLSEKSLVSINSDDLSQAIDVNLSFHENEEKASRGLPGYFTCGWKKASDKILECSSLGINYISLRFVSSSEDYSDINEAVKDFESKLISIINEISSTNVKLIVDPFGLSLSSDGQWGVINEEGNLSEEKTSKLLFDIGCILSRNNVHGVVTLGRIPNEVQKTKEGIIEGGNITQIYSFSQNSETSTAYVYLDTPGHNTGQKILPGNIVEMDLWALVDVWHGADVSVIKPMESYNLILSIRNLLDDTKLRDDFLNSQAVNSLVESNDFIKKALLEMKGNSHALEEKCKKVKLAAYTVSGTTFMLSLLANEKGESMAYSRLHEILVNAKAVASNRFHILIDRNATSFIHGKVLN